MKRDEITARLSAGETVFADGGGPTTSFSIGPKRCAASPIRADQFGYLRDAGLISEAKKEQGQPWYQTRWKGTAHPSTKRRKVRGGAKVPKPASKRRVRGGAKAPLAFGVGGGWDPYFFKGRLP